MADAKIQLKLLEVAPFTSGPARLPKARKAKSAETVSLLLPLAGIAGDEPPPPPPSPSETNRLQAIARAQERLRARLEKPAPAPAPPRPVDEEAAAEEVGGWAQEEAGDERVFVIRRRTSGPERSEIVRVLVERLPAASLRRDGAFEARLEGDSIVGRIDPKALRVTFAGRSARARFLSTVQQVAREYGLVEPD